ncbi:MAG: TlpA family protein disulfide reductase [Xanthomonadales bacterium]|nr:TlpA family protein disulfide reductase [Xanthomonadales bacterium]
MPNRTTLLIILVALLGALAGFWAGGALQQRPTPGPTATRASIGIGDPAPDFALPDLAGVTRSLADFRSRPLLVNFWATWCAPCVEEMPLLAALRARQAPGGLEVIGIALDDPAAVRDFVAELAIDYPILLDTPGRGDTSVRYGDVQGVLPYTVLVDAQGRIAAVRAGSFSAESLDRFVAPVDVTR